MTGPDTSSLIVRTDGASHGNPGPAGIGVVVQHPDGAVRQRLYQYIGRTTNNVAEYTALLRGLEAARRLGARRVHVQMDSELVARQMQGRYRVRHATLQPLHAACRRLAEGFEECRIDAVPREQNRTADRLAARGVAAQPSTILHQVTSNEASPADIGIVPSAYTGKSRPDRRPPARRLRWEESPGSRGQRKG